MTAPRPTDLLAEIYSQWATEMSRHPEMSVELLRIIFDDWQRATGEPEDVTYSSRTVGGVPGLWVSPKNAEPGQVLLFLHGGGFALGSSTSHRKMVGHLAKAVGVCAFIADFRLAPEYPFPAQIDDSDAAFEGLVADGYRPENVIPVGDSAGGNLAISLVLRLIERKAVLPRQVVVMSPWLNMENNGATLDSNDPTDFLITRAGLQANIDRYLGGKVSAADARVNPLYADFTGFPRLYINAGSVESLLDDSIQLEERAKRAGVDVTLTVAEGMQHVYPFLAGKHPDADAEMVRIADWFWRR
ncbi:alpha/beta hydrolase [Paraburkholderia bryophila]|uniref:Acetyl esterase/lipase n=1 Tax=Paraburkholderia bryophila TaxID=420952 RepID=A0A329CFN6_9BURK|nr:alpha/beta hydrolase [Paraburkholderia bryophila]RAS33158.1 acetyl esterase/lipase [Paraburkholderia bryophila]